MNWQDYITADPFVCEGKACFKDTHIMVSVVFENLATGATPDNILKSYPSLSPEAIQAALAFVAELTQEQIFNISQLAAHRQVKVAGKLDTTKLSDHTFILITAEKHSVVKGVADSIDLQTLTTLLDKNVLVSGIAHFTNEGKLLLLEAEQIIMATERDLTLWGQEPTPLYRPFKMSDFQKIGPGISAIIGKWPGDETDEEVLRALEELS